MMDRAELFQMTQYELKSKLYTELRELKYTPVFDKGFLFAQGDVPVLLVAHMDTVHKNQPEHIWMSMDGNQWKADEGIGGDDRCGVWIILEMIKKYHCSVLFCEDEEVGCDGATEFTMSNIDPHVNFIIEFDRKENNDAVFYDCDNQDFEQMITSYGFQTRYGSFSDISVIAPHLKVAAVNLSSGYYKPHTNDEYIDWNDMRNTADRAMQILENADEHYIYIESKYASKLWNNYMYSTAYDSPAYNYADFYYENTLMPFVGMIKLPDGSLIESDAFYETYAMDEKGRIYEYIPEEDAYWLIDDGAVACDPVTGAQIHFDPEQAINCYSD